MVWQDGEISYKIIVKICKVGNSVDVFLNIAEEKIRQAIRNGDLDYILGKGKPLQLEVLFNGTSRVKDEL